MLDSLQGDLSMNVLVKVVDLPVWLDNRDLNAPVDLHFTDGKLDYKRLQSGLNKGVTMKMADEENEKSTGLGNYVAHALEFWMDDPKTLVLGLHLIDLPAGGPDDQSGQTVPILKSLVRWNLESGEIADAAAGKLRLFRAIDPEKKKSSGGGGEGPVLVNTLEFRNILANLSVRSKDEDPVQLCPATRRRLDRVRAGRDRRPARRRGRLGRRATRLTLERPGADRPFRGQPRRREHRVDVDGDHRRGRRLDRGDHDHEAQGRPGRVQPSEAVQLRRDHREGGREQHPVGCVN